MLIRLTVNHRNHDIETWPGLSLLAVLRDDLNLTGTKYGCGHGGCGACMVILDGVATPSCQLPVEDAAGKAILTIEGLSRNGSLHPVQRAFIDEDAMQCGYCTSGMIMSAVALLTQTPHPTDDQVRDALQPHLCRCGVYARVLRAVKKAAR
jgi:aerobic-type carbon monoxide dehydrogenase small subunit (CoxS/CutS family)